MDSQWLLGKQLDSQAIPEWNMYICETYGSSLWVLDQDFFLLIFYSREFSDIPASTSLLHQWQHKGGGEGGERNWANRVGDIRLHFQGVERIELPQFPHLRRTEARNQCDQRCLSEPLIPSIRHASSPPLPLYSFSHLYTLKRSRAHFFF